MQLVYEYDVIPEVGKIVALYDRAQMPRPTGSEKRMVEMFENSNLMISARDGNKLVGLIRCLTDHVWYTFLADLAVDPEYKKLGIGKKLIELVREKVGEKTSIILLSVATAMEYYPKVGFTKDDRAFSITRTK